MFGGRKSGKKAAPTAVGPDGAAAPVPAGTGDEGKPGFVTRRNALKVGALAVVGVAAGVAIDETRSSHRSPSPTGGSSPSGIGTSSPEGGPSSSGGRSAVTSSSPFRLPTIVFPAGAGHVDVTAHGADKTGRRDSTDIINGIIKSFGPKPFKMLTLYFPAGTYLISAPLVSLAAPGAWVCCVTYQGENRDTTTIKLKDGTWKTGQYGAPNVDGPTQSMIYTASQPYSGAPTSGGGNEAFCNFVYDLTLDVGDNPTGGAINFIGNNVGAVRRVKLICTHAYIGLDIGRAYIGPLMIQDVDISGGFRYPAVTAGPEYSVILDRVNIGRGSGSYSFLNEGPLAALESCTFAQPVHITNAGALMSYWDCDAIKTSNAAEGDAWSVYYGPGSAGYKITPVATPQLPYDPAAKWVDATSHPSLQAAVDTGASTVYYPAGSQATISSTTTLPATLTRLIFMGDGPAFATGRSTVFKTAGASSKPLIIQRAWVNVPTDLTGEQNTITLVEHAAKRDLVIEDWLGWGIVQMVEGAGRVFFDDVFLRCNITPGGEFYARQLNWEDPFVPAVVNDGGRAWIMGLKWESSGKTPTTPIVTGSNGGRTELIGGFNYPYIKIPPALPAYRFADQSFAVQWLTNAFVDNQSYTVNVTATVKGSRLPAVASTGKGFTQSVAARGFGSYGTASLSVDGG